MAETPSLLAPDTGSQTQGLEKGVWLAAWQPLPTAITPPTTPSLSLLRQIPAGSLTWGVGGRGGWGVTESLVEGKIRGLRYSRSPGVSCNHCTCSLSCRLRLLLLLLADTPGGWQAGRQLRGCGEVGASHICTRVRACIHTYYLSLSHTHSLSLTQAEGLL